jgi:hypothetical protein
MKRRYFYRESLNQVHPPPRTITDKDSIKLMMQHRQNLAQGKTEEELAKSPLFPNIGSAVEVGQMQRTMMAGLIQADERTSGKVMVDPCFKWVIAHPGNEIMYARSWRKSGKMVLSKTEGLKRREEWNTMVDEYIAKRAALNDHRSVQAIERLNKVCWNGSAMFKICGHPTCDIQEDTDGQFKLCSACQIVAYHSKDCQKAHWKAHTRECGKDHTEHALPSQLHMTTLMQGCVTAASAGGW